MGFNACGLLTWTESAQFVDRRSGFRAPAGYVNLTDQLNDIREELEEKIDEQNQLVEALEERNQLRLAGDSIDVKLF